MNPKILRYNRTYDEKARHSEQKWTTRYIPEGTCIHITILCNSNYPAAIPFSYCTCIIDMYEALSMNDGAKSILMHFIHNKHNADLVFFGIFLFFSTWVLLNLVTKINFLISSFSFFENFALITALL